LEGPSEDNLQSLSGGKVFVGFGPTPLFSEFSATGRLAFDGAWPVDDGSYRAYRYRWHAMPRTRPVAVVHRISSSAVAVYVTWNGATSVARWRVLAGNSGGALRAATTTRKQGFETRIEVTTATSSFRVQALGADGRVLGTSAPAGVS
jgi:hypothetical protein